MALKAYRVILSGLVQGVGFRPFTHRIAVLSGVKGYVRNVGGSEVEIHIEGDEEAVSKFFKLFTEQLPPPAEIEEISIRQITPQNYTSFEIQPSTSKLVKRSMIPPDFAICNECLREVLDPGNRRYKYPFNSCAWCGPRFSMMYSTPYDRANTSMKKYPLCLECMKEYEDVMNVRRHHAQGICCPADGPKLMLRDLSGNVIESKDPIAEAAKLIDEGYIIAIKGIGGYHIAALASNDDVVFKLRQRKKRPQKPFAVMALNLDIIKKLVYLEPPTAIEILTSPQRPIVLLPKKEDTPVSKLVSPGMDVEGVFLPYTALHYLLLSEVRDKFLIMTSANIHGEPMCKDFECVTTKLRGVVDFVLDHDREIVHRVDDSVVRFTDGKMVILRRGRGYAPRWIKLPLTLNIEIIAFGAHLQTCGGVGFERFAVLTPYIGDLDSIDALSDLENELLFLINSYKIDIHNAVLVHDKHPEYASTQLATNYAKRFNTKTVAIQHHHAHILATLADRGVLPEDKVVGIAIDGVGYGDDGMVWGGEVLELEGSGYRRVAHLEYIPLTSDRDTIYPTRFLYLVLVLAIGFDKARNLLEKLGLVNTIPYGELELDALEKLLHSKRYVYTSSMGRVLDAISALLRVCTHRTYEGEPAIKLESKARNGKLIEEIRSPRLINDGNTTIVKSTELVLDIINGLESDYAVKDLAFTAQYRLGQALALAALNNIRGRRNILQLVAVGGGAAVNSFIVRGMNSILSREGIELVLPRKVPPNDGGIPLGQIYGAALKVAEHRDVEG